MNRMIVPTKAETEREFIGPLNPHVGRFARLAPGVKARVHSNSIVRVNRHALGPRVYVGGHRVHHGPAFGLAAVLCWRLRWRHLAVALGAYAATDARDFPFTDRNNH